MQTEIILIFKGGGQYYNCDIFSRFVCIVTQGTDFREVGKLYISDQNQRVKISPGLEIRSVLNVKGATRMNIAICDDQKECNDNLRQMLKSYFRANQINNCEIKEYTSGDKLSKEYAPGMFDFIFLDVQMPGMSGLETAERIRSQDLSVDIIFVTNMRDQMRMGFNYNAKGFLIKEVSQDELDALMDRLVAEMRRREGIGVYPIKLKFDNGIVFLRLSDVLYFESHDKDVTAKTIDGDFEFRKQLSVVEQDLIGKGFLRINRSLLVNTSCIFKDFGDCLVLRGLTEELPIGNNYKAFVRKALSMRGTKG